MTRKLFRIRIQKWMCFSVFLFLTCIVYTQEVAPPVESLKSLYQNDAELKETINLMLENVQDFPDGTPNPWKGKDVEDLFSFLNDWYYFLPDPHNGLDRILEFSFLYHDNPAGMRFILEEPGMSWTNEFVDERGQFMDSPESAEIISLWLDDNSLANEDFIYPVEGFKSFNEFFIRDLIPGARRVDQVDDPSVLVSPADGVINMIANELTLDTQLPTKGMKTMSLNQLLEHSKYADKFVGGTAMAVFLMPDNYHHYHAPTSGTIVESNEEVGHRLFGMNDIPDMINKGNVAYNKDYSVFENFKHGYFIIETESFGYIGMIPIGLQTVGSVVFEDKLKKVTGNGDIQKVYKGQKLGHFAYGGSTVLLIFEPGRLSSISVQQGQRIGKLR